jgi:hypothetical protein
MERESEPYFNMKRLMQSITFGVFFTLALTVVAMEVGSEKVGCFLIWQACLFDALFSDHADREFPIVGIIGIFFGIPIYASVAYLFLGKFKFGGPEYKGNNKPDI